MGRFDTSGVRTAGIPPLKPLFLCCPSPGDEVGVVPCVGEHLNEFIINNRKISIQEEKFFVSTNGLLAKA